MNWLLIAGGGFIGACSRFALSIWLNGKGKWGTSGTWLANFSGSALLAFLWILQASDWLWSFAGIGFAGAFTTFSTFGKETIDLLEKEKTKEAIQYVGFSLFSSLVIVGVFFLIFS